MKGLLLKDLYTIKGFEKQYGIISALLLLFSIVMKDMSIAAIYFVILCSMQVLSTLSVDEAVHFDRWALTTPAGAKNLVGEKYVLLCLTLGTGIIIGFLLNWISGIFFGTAIPTADTVSAPILMFVISYAVMLPVCFKAGVEKARYVYMGVLFGITAFMAGWYKIFNMSESVLLKNATESVFMNSAGIRILSVAGICILLLTISYKISLKTVRNKDW